MENKIKSDISLAPPDPMLFLTIPEAAIMWDYEKNKFEPTDENLKSTCKVWWKCSKGHEFERTVANFRRKQSCPICSKASSTVAGKPWMMRIWDTEKNTLNPQLTQAKSAENAFWKCPSCGYEWMAPIYGRIRRETKPYRIASCPACSGNARNITMDKQFPELIDLYSENNEIPLSEVTGNWQKKYIWICKKHGKITSVLSSMVRAIRSGNNGCPFCHGTQVKAEESFGTLYPDLVEEWDSSNQKTPFEVTAGSSNEAAWKCSKGHTWKAAVSERANGGKLCPECFPNGNRPSFNAMHPDLKKFFCKENPVQFEKGVISDYTPYLWKAECSHTFTDSFALINERGFRCPYCTDLKVLAGYNDFQTRYPEYSSSFDAEKNKISASEVTCRESDSTRWWKCKYGHAYQRSVRTQIAYKGVCPVCSLHVLQTV